MVQGPAPRALGLRRSGAGALSRAARASGALFLALLLSGAWGRAGAQDVAYDAFAYAAGGLPGQNGGTGWSGAWGAGNIDVVATGLSYAGLTVAGRGTRANLPSMFSVTTSTRALATTLGNPGTVVWFSFLVKPDRTSIADYCGINFGGASQFFVGYQQTNFTLNQAGVPGSGSSVAFGAVPFTVGSTAFIVVRVAFTAGADTATIYVNPSAGATAPDSPGSLTATKSNLDVGTFSAITLSAGRGLNANAAELDEVRIGSNFAEVASGPRTTTLATGSDPGSVTIAPGGPATMAGAFTFRTSAGTDSITAVTVALGAGAAAGLSLVEITNDAGTAVYGSAGNPAGDTPAITLTTKIGATATATQHKIRVTPRSHAAMPRPQGATYLVAPYLSGWTGTNGQLGSDAAGTTVTIDNLSPDNVTAATATAAGSGQVSLGWTNPVAGDLDSIVVLRRAGSAVADTVAEGIRYSVGNTVGSSTVACVVAAAAAACTDTGLVNGTAYHYRVFARDTLVNHATGVVPTGSPATPVLPVPVLVLDDAVSPGGASPPGTDLAYTISFGNTGTGDAVALVIVDSLAANVDFKVGSVTAAPGTSGLTHVVAYSDDGGLTFAYTPASGGGGAPAGYDRNVTHVRWTFSGDLSGIPPNNTASVGFTAKIR